MWYGVLPGGACGMFDPAQTKPYVKPEVSETNCCLEFEALKFF